MKDEYEYEDEVRTLKPHVELHESVIGFHEVSYKRFRGWRAMNTGRFEDIGGMAFFPEVSSPGLWPGKEDGVCSRLRVEGADSSRHYMAEDNV